MLRLHAVATDALGTGAVEAATTTAASRSLASEVGEAWGKSAGAYVRNERLLTVRFQEVCDAETSRTKWLVQSLCRQRVRDVAATDSRIDQRCDAAKDRLRWKVRVRADGRNGDGEGVEVLGTGIRLWASRVSVKQLGSPSPPEPASGLRPLHRQKCQAA